MSANSEENTTSINPYQPSDTRGGALTQEKKRLKGFARGARNGALGSMPVAAVVIWILVVSENYRLGRAIYETLFIPTIWILAAGLAASVADRNRPPEPSDDSIH